MIISLIKNTNTPQCWAVRRTDSTNQNRKPLRDKPETKQEPKQTTDQENRNESTERLNTDQTQDAKAEIGTIILY